MCSYLGDFPGGPVVKTSPSNAGSIPGWGARIPHASWPKSQNIKQKQYCNKNSIKTLKKMVQIFKKVFKNKGCVLVFLWLDSSFPIIAEKDSILRLYHSLSLIRFIYLFICLFLAVSGLSCGTWASL